MIKDWFDRFTSWIAYLMSAFGMGLSNLTDEQLYFIVSSLIGLGALGLNFWHKRAIQRIAAEKGVTINEAD
ncbi:hypothetical protein [Vibrio hepatarius]|uniref:hypothetical protein n=1 Tax=Vibrio hepatarius TaxID=171383 RepID=UPI00169F0AE1|nr:hypothetical protein [Vibrio hepatarius]NOI15780.1 hypothetical protein [Vibrio hepatarius]